MEKAVKEVQQGVKPKREKKEIGIMAGASTPKESIKEVEEYLKSL